MRAIVGAAAERRRAPSSLIEANLDDLLPELAPDAAAACFAAGALDVWTTPAQMKRGRPGFVLSALARPADERAVADGDAARDEHARRARSRASTAIELERESRTVEVGRRAGAREGRPARRPRRQPRARARRLRARRARSAARR